MNKPSIWQAIGEQLQNPSGLAGYFTGMLMRIANREPNRLAVKALRIASTDTVLELGCGPGYAIQLMERKALAGRVHGLDHSAVMIEQAAKRNRIAIREGRVVLHQTRIYRLPFRDSAIDKILAVNVIYFWEDLPAVLKEICRVLRPGGLVSLYATDKATMDRWKFAGPETHRLYDAADLSRAIQQAGIGVRLIRIRKVRIIGSVQGLVTTLRLHRWPAMSPHR
jgi:ubiquinone/menaquinone biosynthesis C-methylase UbiE